MSKRKDKLAERVFRATINYMKYERDLKRAVGQHLYNMTHMPLIVGMSMHKPETKERCYESNYYKYRWKKDQWDGHNGVYLDLFKKEY